MDRTNGGLSGKRAVLIPVSKSSVVFEKVVAPLQNAYLYKESKQAFKYTSAFLFNNSTLQEKYEAFRANRREAGYSEEELKEGYGFLLFDDINKATELGETGVLTGNSACKTLGDPSKGVYIARYSDCLAPDHWYCGKSGFIVIIRLTKGRINKVQENYTQNCIAPSDGFDCHESKELPRVSANTSSFLAYERTQYYLYELLSGECSKKNLSPSHVCPFAIVPFSYDDANGKATTSSCQEQSGTKGNVINGIIWSGQLHISSQIFHVRLKSRLGALIPVKLPPVVKVDQAVSMVTLRQFAPKAVFESNFSGEVSLDGICCSVHEFVPKEVGDPSLSLLIRELKDKDLGLTVHLNENGFLILLHSSNFATSTGNESSITEALQVMFLFPGSRAIQKDSKGEFKDSKISPDILHLLPALNYAEMEMQKSSIGPREDKRGQYVQQMKNYAALIQTGLAETTSKDISPLLQDYDKSVTCPFSNPKWTNLLWQWLRSYLSHPVSFQLPVYSVTELLTAGNKLQKEVLNDEQAPGTVCSIGSDELLSQSTAHDVSSSWQKGADNKDSETNSILNSTLSHNPIAELVVSITSAEGNTKIIDNGLSGSEAVVATKQLSNTIMTSTNTVHKNPLENSTGRKKLPRGRPKGKRKCFKRSSPPADEPLTSTSDKPVEERQAAQCTSVNDPSKTQWTILSTSHCRGGKLTYKYKKVQRFQHQQENAFKQTKLRRMDNVTSACSLIRKMDRWDLKPILTGCGRTLVPHGSLNGLLQKTEHESTECEQHLKEMMSETSEEASKLEKMDQDPVAERLAVNIPSKVNAGDKCHNTEVGCPHYETSSSPQEFEDMVNIVEADTTEGVLSNTADNSSHGKDRNKSEHLLCKLKNLFLRRKRKTTQLVLGDSVLPVDAQPSTEPSLGKGKSDMDKEMLNTESNTDCQDSRESNKDVLRAFAQALGLMPKEVPGMIQTTESMDTLENPLPISLEGQFIPPEGNSAQFIQMVPSPIQQKLQVKRLLQKRKKWGTRFHTPISCIAESPKNKVCAKSNSLEKNLKEPFCSTDQSNPLSLLADLALGDINHYVQPQLNPLPMAVLDPRLDVDNLLSDGTKSDNQSVLLSTQPADGTILPSNSPPPKGLLGSKDMVVLIGKEHDYTSSITLQVPTTSSTAGIPLHSQILSGPELQALSNVPPEGTSEHKASIGHMNKDAIPSRRFRRSRTFVEEDGFLKVTRKWKGNYDFDLDSKFTNHPVEKTVCRGLHGSWNFAVRDNGEEAQLIIHMWIGLFYSRSTPRFIHSTPLDLEDCLETSNGMVLSPAVLETATVSSGNSAHILEPIQEDGLVLNQGAEVLDLSVKKQDANDCSDISVSCHESNGKDATEAFIREEGIQDEDPAQCQAKHQALQVYRSRSSEFDGADNNMVKSTSEKADTSQQSATNLEHSAANSLSEDCICKVIANIIIQPQPVVETKASIDPESTNIETSERKEKHTLQNTEVAVVPTIEMDSGFEIMKGIVEDPNSSCTYLVGTEECDGDDSKYEDHRNNADFCLQLSENEDYITEHKSPVPYENVPDNKKQSADVGSITLSRGCNENMNEDKDCRSASHQGHFTKEEDNNLNPKSVSDGHGTIKGDDPGVSCQSSPVRQLPEEDGKQDASTEEMLQIQCANFNASMGGGTEDNAISVENSNIALDKTLPEEHDDNETVAKMKMLREQEKSNNSAGLQDGIVDESQAEVLPDVSVAGCDHQEPDDELTENAVETAYILAPEAASHCRAQSPQDGLSKIAGKDISKQEVVAGPQVIPFQDNLLGVHKPQGIPMTIDVYRTSLENCAEVPIAENVPSVFEDSDSTHELSSEDIEVDERCPRPTNDNGPGIYCQVPLIGQLCDGDGKKDESSDDTISEENLNIALDKTLPEENDDHDSMDEANIEIVSQQNKFDNDSTPLQDDIVGESQAEVLPDMSVVGCGQQESNDDLIENEVETSYILALKAASHHRAQSSQGGLSKLHQDANEMPLVGKNNSKKEVVAGPQGLPFQDNPFKGVHEPQEIPMSIDVYHTSQENCGKVPIAENVPSVFEDSDSTHKLGSEDLEADERCPRPTKNNGPEVYCQMPLVGHLCEGDGKKDESSDDTTSEENLNIALDKTLPEENDDHDYMDEANIEIVSQPNKFHNDSTPLQDGIVGESQAEVLPDVSVVGCDHQEQEDKLVENEVEPYILAPKSASHHRAQSSRDGVSNFLQDASKKLLVGKHKSRQEVEAGPQVLPLQDNVVVVHEPLQTQCVNPNAFMGGDGDSAISEENVNITLDKTLPEVRGHIDSVDEANIEIVSQQSKSDKDSTRLQDGVVGESEAEVLPGVSVAVCDRQEPDDELMENKVETSCILAPEAAFHYRAQSSQEGVSKLLQDASQMPLVGRDKSRQELEADLQGNAVEVVHEPKEMPLNMDVYPTVLENSGGFPIAANVEAGPQVLPFQVDTLEMANEPKEMAMNMDVYHMSPENIQLDKNTSSVFVKCDDENKLVSETSEFDERCPTPTIDESPYEGFPSLEPSTSNEVCKISPEEQSSNQPPTPCWKSMDMDNLNDKSSLVNGFMPPAKQLLVKRKRAPEEHSVPCPPKKMCNNEEICKAPEQRRLRDDSHPCRLNPVVVLQPLRTDSPADDIYKVKEMNNPAVSNASADSQDKIPVIPNTLTDTLLDNKRDVFNHTSEDNQHEDELEICSRAGRVSRHGVGQRVLNKPNSIDAVYHVEKMEEWTLGTVPSIVSTQSDQGENLPSSNFQDPIRGHSSSTHTGPSTSSFKYTNYRFTKTVSKSSGQRTETCRNSDLTQFSIEQEFLIFSEEMRQLLNYSKRVPGKNPNHGSMYSYPSSDGQESVLDLSMGADMPESSTKETTEEKLSHRCKFPSKGNRAEANAALSNIKADCARSYQTMMNNVCAGKGYLTKTHGPLKDSACSSRQTRSGMFGSLNHSLDLVRKSSKTKFRFYILMTSEDPFFEETKAQLEADGHTEVQPSHFYLNEPSSSSSLLLIILKNEDIAEHIIKVPHILDLKKSANVLFAGIDQPEDIGNLTHQDLFKKGGFIMLERVALEALSFSKMKELLGFLQELSKNGKWKWIMHYRDSRRFKENARFSVEEEEKKHLIKSCQETGIVEVLPYHECDHSDRPHPRYLRCLLQLQVQNISARFPVFVTDKTYTTEDATFGRHGILTMNINSLLTVIESEHFSPSTSI